MDTIYRNATIIAFYPILRNSIQEIFLKFYKIFWQNKHQPIRNHGAHEKLYCKIRFIFPISRSTIHLYHSPCQKFHIQPP